jgi:hypothetical protein
MVYKAYKIRVKSFVLVLLIFLAGIIQVPAENYYKWQRFSGNWVITDSILEEKQVWASPWYFYELLNYNTLMSRKSIDTYSTFTFQFIVTKPAIEIKTLDKEPALMAAFNIRSPYKSWYFHMCAIKITGNSEYLDKISLVFSDRIDKTKKYAVKHNTFVKELAAKKIKLDYGKEYALTINLVGNNAIAAINNIEVLSGQIPVNEHGGKFALSCKNLVFKVKKVSVYNNNEIVFNDDFSHNSIYILKMRARRSKKK